MNSQRLTLSGRTPAVADGAWIAPTAVLAGEVRIRERASVFYNAVLRADLDVIQIGEATNVQDGAIVHSDPGHPAHVGSRVSIGHGAVLHGCIVEDECLIGMNSTVLNGAVIGRGSLVAAGALVPEGMRVPPGSLVAGVPGKVRRQLTEAEQADIRDNAVRYEVLATEHSHATTD